jgi:hypothetical protein
MTRRQWAAQILHIPESATIEQARQAHRDLIQIWHPDLHNTKSESIRELAKSKTQELNLAIEVFQGIDLETFIPGTSQDTWPDQSTSSKYNWDFGERSTYDKSAHHESWGRRTYSSPGPTASTDARTYQSSDAQSHQSQKSSSNLGCAGGAVIGGVIGLLFGGWGAVPGVLIGAFIGGSIGSRSSEAGSTIDEAGGCLWSSIVGVIETIFGCGCLLVVAAAILIIVMFLANPR